MMGTKAGDQGEAAARLEALFQRHYMAVAAYVSRRAHPDLVEDVVAETFFVAWRRLDDVTDLDLPWLIGVARKTLATNRRSVARRLRLAEKLVSAPTSPADDIWDETVEVRSALAALSDRDREAITLIAWDGLSPQEAAAALGQSPVAFRVRLHRAKKRLRELLSDRPVVESRRLELSEPRLEGAQRA
jgi:RNA polymerase sigma-70 factor, ECF subfamily